MPKVNLGSSFITDNKSHFFDAKKVSQCSVVLQEIKGAEQDLIHISMGICKSWKQKWNWKLETELETGNGRQIVKPTCQVVCLPA